MARFIRKVGQSTVRYLFELSIHSVELRVPFEAEVSATFRCGTKRQESKQCPKVTQTNPIASFNEKLTLLSSLVKDKTTSQLQERFAHIIIALKKDDKEKNVGVVKLNLLEFLEGTSKRKVALEKCPDKQACIEFSLKTTLINNMGGGSETQSMMSCDVSVDSGPESEYDFGDLQKDPGDVVRAGKTGNRASSVQRLSRVMIKTDARPPLKMPELLSTDSVTKIQTIPAIQIQKAEVKKIKLQENPFQEDKPSLSPNIINRIKTQISQQPTQKQDQALNEQRLEYQAQIQTLMTQKDTLKDQLSRSDQDKSILEQERNQLKLLLKQKDLALKESNEQIGVLNAQSYDDRVSKEMEGKQFRAKYEQMEQGMQSKVDSLQVSNKQLESMLAIQRQAGKDMLQKIQTMQKDIDSGQSKQQDQYLLQSLKTKAEQELGLARQQLQDLQDVQLPSKELELSQQRHQVTELQSQKQQLTKQLQEAESLYQAQTKVLKESQDQLSQLQKTALNQREQWDQEQQSLVKRGKERETKIKMMDQKIKGLEEEILSLQEDCKEKVQSQKVIMEYQLQDSRRRVMELEGIVQMSKQKVEVVRQQDQGEEVAKLKAVVERLQLENLDLQNIVKARPVQVGRVGPDREITKIQVENDVLRRELQEVQSRAKQQQAVQNGLDQQERMVMEADKRQVMEDKQYLEQECERVRADYFQAEERLVEAKMMWAQLDMECDELTINMKKRDQVIKDYQQRMTKLEIDLAKAHNQLNNSGQEDDKQIKKQGKIGQLLSVFNKKEKKAERAKTEETEETKR